MSESFFKERPETEPPMGLAQGIELEISQPGGHKIRKFPQDIRGLVQGVELERSIAASSTVTITTRDPDRKLFKVGYFDKGTRPDLLLDGLWFRCILWEKAQADEFKIKFEDREVAIAREYKSGGHHNFKMEKAPGRDNPMAHFIERLLKKAAPHATFFCPELDANTRTKQKKSKKKKETPREKAARLKRIKAITGSYVLAGKHADPDQKKNIEEVLDVIDQRAPCPPNAALAIICAGLAETGGGGFHTNETGPEGAVGVFQINPAVHPPSVVHAGTRKNAEEWLDKGFAGAGGGIALARAGHSPGEIAFLVEKPNKDASFFEKHKGEAEAILKEHHGGAPANTATTEGSEAHHGSPQVIYSFPKSEKKEGEEPEGAWECALAYATELKWRLVCRAGRFYLVSDDWLKKNHSFHVSEGDPGVVDVKWAIDIRKRRNPERLTLDARAHLWEAPPGATIRFGEEQGRDVHEGIWIVSTIRRAELTDNAVEITLERPESPLAETAVEPAKQAANAVVPAALSNIGNTNREGGPVTGPAGVNANKALWNMFFQANWIENHHFIYFLGAGHRSTKDFSPGQVATSVVPQLGYDCSSAVSAILGAADLLAHPYTTDGLEFWGEAGEGKYLTVWVHPRKGAHPSGHTFIELVAPNKIVPNPPNFSDQNKAKPHTFAFHGPNFKVESGWDNNPLHQSSHTDSPLWIARHYPGL